jgi:hypothetical protein
VLNLLKVKNVDYELSDLDKFQLRNQGNQDENFKHNICENELRRFYEH